MLTREQREDAQYRALRRLVKRHRSEYVELLREEIGNLRELVRRDGALRFAIVRPGREVATPQGIGTFLRLEGDNVIVEMDHEVAVVFPAWRCQPVYREAILR